MSCVENVLLIYYASTICWFVYIGKNPRFTAFLDSNLYTRLTIVTENELGLAFSPRNLPKKNSSRSLHVLFSYRGNKQTNKQTDRQTNAGNSIIPRESFRGDNKKQNYDCANQIMQVINRWAFAVAPALCPLAPKATGSRS